MKERDFAEFNNRYAGQTCYVVGRGSTTYRYEDLRAVTEPVFFINDAVFLDRYVSAESFFMAHDRDPGRWLEMGIKSTPVLPEDGKIVSGRDDPLFANFAGEVVFYKWQRMEGEKLIRLDRNEVAGKRELYRNTGTIHSLLHFVWYCGFKKIRFIGCDGSTCGSTYDPRLPNLSQTRSWGQYESIRRVQDRLCRHFRFEVEYLSSSPSATQNSFRTEKPQIPKIAHFAWFGSEVPQAVLNNVEMFRRYHQDWEIHLWTSLPDELDADLRKIIESVDLLCMHSDVIRPWLLHRYGGLYIDTDIYTLRSMEELRYFDHFAAAGNQPGAIYNGVMGSRPGSAVMANFLRNVRAVHVRNLNPGSRTRFGPGLLREWNDRYPQELNILPAHYFYVLHTQGSVLKFIEMDRRGERPGFDSVRKRITDGVEPFALHMWGIPANQMPDGKGRSSWARMDRKTAVQSRDDRAGVASPDLPRISDGAQSAKIEHFYQHLGERWFVYPSLYKSMVERGASGSTFVEVGSWKGASASFMAVEIANSGKKIDFVCVDTWAGSDEHQHFPEVKSGRLYDIFIQNITPVKDYIKPLRMASVSASAQFPDETVDFVFIDGAHDFENVYADITAWYPKVKCGGVIAGHDYLVPKYGVARAVEQFFGSEFRNVRSSEGCWIYDKTGDAALKTL